MRRGRPRAASFVLHTFFWHCHDIGQFFRVDFSFESCTVLDDDTAAEDIAFDVRSAGQRDSAFAVDVSDKLSQYDDGIGLDVGPDPGVFAHRQLLFVMGDQALELPFNE